MGLDDIYYKRPYAPAQDVNAQMTQGMEALGQVPERNARLQGQQLANEGQRQQNADAAYTSPSAPASPASNIIGQHILARLRTTPGHSPEYEQRLLGELSGGGQPAPAAQGAPGAGLQSPSTDNGAGSTPRGDSEFQGGLMPRLSVSREVPQPQQPPQPAQPAQVPQVQLRQAPSSDPSMTNQDVDRTMRMAPFLKLDQPTKEDPRIAIANQKDKLARDRMAQSQKFLDQEDALKRELARLSASVSLANGDSDRKAILAQMKMVNDMRMANIRAKAQQTSGIGGVVYDQATQQSMAQEDAADAQSLKEMEDLNAKLEAAMGKGAGGRSVKTRVSGPQGPPPPAAAQPGGKIRVKVKASGETGQIPANEFDPNVYERM